MNEIATTRITQLTKLRKLKFHNHLNFHHQSRVMLIKKRILVRSDKLNSSEQSIDHIGRLGFVPTESKINTERD